MISKSPKSYISADDSPLLELANIFIYNFIRCEFIRPVRKDGLSYSVILTPVKAHMWILREWKCVMGWLAAKGISRNSSIRKKKLFLEDICFEKNKRIGTQISQIIMRHSAPVTKTYTAINVKT